MGKRGSGEGSIHKRSDGRWVAIVDLGREGRKRRRKYIYGATRREVQERLLSAMRDHQQGVGSASERLTVEQFLAKWLEEFVKKRRRAKTYSSYAEMARLYLVPGLGRYRLSRLSAPQIDAFLNRKLEEGLSTRTVQYMHAVLRSAYSRAVKWHLVGANPARLADAPTVRRDEIQPLTPEDARQFLNASRGDRLEALYSVAIAAGLRPGESLGLRWDDVDLDRRLLRVRSSVQRIKGAGLVVEELKSEHSKRTINLPQVCIDALRGHKERQDNERDLAGERWEEHGLVFPNTLGKPLEPRNVVRSFKHRLGALGLPDARFYDLRHTCASFLLAQGVEPRVVMEILGHAHYSFTMKTYAHVLPTMRQAAAARMDEVLRTPPALPETREPNGSEDA